MRIAFPLVALLAALILSSCASLTKQECVVADWHSIGERDGAAGRPLSYFNRHVDACKKTTAQPDHAGWQAGHRFGARRFCTPQNGLKAGNAGKTYHNICSPDQQRDFLPAFELGKERYNLLSQRRQLANELDSNRNEITRLKTKAAKKGLDRKAIRPKIRSIRHRNRRILDEVEETDYRIVHLDRQIDQLGYAPLARPAPVF